MLYYQRHLEVSRQADPLCYRTLQRSLSSNSKAASYHLLRSMWGMSPQHLWKGMGHWILVNGSDMQFRIECTKNNLARSRTSACCCTRCQDNSATKWACKYQHLLSIPSFLGASFVYSRKSITVPNTKVASFPFILGTSTFLQTDKFVSWHCSKYS